MRDRHFPRICGSCQAPLGRQQDACWRCDTDWTTENPPATRLRVIAGGALAQAGAETMAARANGSLRAAAEELAGHRWMDEGGHP